MSTTPATTWQDTLKATLTAAMEHASAVNDMNDVARLTVLLDALQRVERLNPFEVYATSMTALLALARVKCGNPAEVLAVLAEVLRLWSDGVALPKAEAEFLRIIRDRTQEVKASVEEQVARAALPTGGQQPQDVNRPEPTVVTGRLGPRTLAEQLWEIATHEEGAAEQHDPVAEVAGLTRLAQQLRAAAFAARADALTDVFLRFETRLRTLGSALRPAASSL